MTAEHHRLPRQTVAFLHDVTMAGLSFVIALALRLGTGVFDYFTLDLTLALIVFVAHDVPFGGGILALP